MAKNGKQAGSRIELTPQQRRYLEDVAAGLDPTRRFAIKERRLSGRQLSAYSRVRQHVEERGLLEHGQLTPKGQRAIATKAPRKGQFTKKDVERAAVEGTKCPDCGLTVCECDEWADAHRSGR